VENSEAFSTRRFQATRSLFLNVEQSVNVLFGYEAKADTCQQKHTNHEELYSPNQTGGSDDAFISNNIGFGDFSIRYTFAKSPQAYYRQKKPCEGLWMIELKSCGGESNCKNTNHII